MNLMRRITTLLALLLTVFAVYAGGIKSAKDLAAFAKAVNKGADISEWRNEKGAVCLEGNIDMAKMKKWVPIKELTCTFDGQGYALMNWKTKQGLFDMIADKGVVRNLRIDSSCSMTVNKGELLSGFIARVNKGTVQNCENNAECAAAASAALVCLFVIHMLVLFSELEYIALGCDL